MRLSTVFDNADEAVVEILHGEGGDDSKHFAAQLREVYERYATRRGLSVTVLDESSGHHVLLVKGRGAGGIMSVEAGKHCVQRIPANDRHGKRHTSFVNVAVLPLPPDGKFVPIPDRELVVSVQTGKQGAGGQNCNKVASAVRMRHVPTGLSVFINGRDQLANKREALRILTAKVNDLRNGNARSAYVEDKSRQLGERGRGGKIRTYSFIEGFVMDHRTGRRTSDVKAVMRGDLSLVR